VGGSSSAFRVILGFTPEFPNARNTRYAFLDAVVEESVQLTRTRAMFVGYGGVGKTTLKTALLLRGRDDHGVLAQLRKSIVETIKVKWREPDVRHWVDKDLAQADGFFDHCSKAWGLTGREWLALSLKEVADDFGGDETPLSRRVVSKMSAVLEFLRGGNDEPSTEPFDHLCSAAGLTKWIETACRLDPRDVDAVRAQCITGADLAEMIVAHDGGTSVLQGFGLSRGAIGAIQRTARRAQLASYGALLDIPHVWTEGIELDDRWEEYVCALHSLRTHVNPLTTRVRPHFFLSVTFAFLIWFCVFMSLLQPVGVDTRVRIAFAILRKSRYTLWDFPGQMEFYPAHRLFLACETAVYVSPTTLAFIRRCVTAAAHTYFASLHLS
jgi:hypothetical protein